MADWIGFLDSSGRPTLKIRLTLPAMGTVEVEALIDTGFDGSLLVPISKVKVNISDVVDVVKVTTAGGVVRRWLISPIVVTVGDEAEVIEAILEPDSTEVLIGMEFVARFGRGLTLFPRQRTVLLSQESPLE